LGGSSGEVVGAETDLTGLEAITAAAGGGLTINDKDASEIAAGGTVNDALKSLNADFNAVGVAVDTISEFTAAAAGSGALGAGTSALNITVVDGDGLSQAFEITGTSSMDEVVAKINESAGGIVQASLSDSGKLVLTAQGAESITVAEGGGGSTTGLAAIGV